MEFTVKVENRLTCLLLRLMPLSCHLYLLIMVILFHTSMIVRINRICSLCTTKHQPGWGLVFCCSLKRRGEITSYRPCQLLGLRRQRQRCYLLVQACQPQLLLLSATVLQLRQRFAMQSG